MSMENKDKENNQTKATVCHDRNLGNLLLLMFQSRLKANQLGSSGLHAKSNCINARQPELSVNERLSTNVFLINVRALLRTVSDWKV